MKRKIGFAVAGVMATVGALLVFLYLKDNRNSPTAAPAAEAPAEVVEEAAPETETENPLAIDGDAAVDAAPVPAPVRADDGSLIAVTVDNEIVEFGEPVVVPDDYLQVSFGLPSERALGGRIRPGDTVAVVVSFNEVIDEDDEEGRGGEVVQTTDVLFHKALVADVQVEDVFGATTSSAAVEVDVPTGALNGTNSQNYTISIAVPSTQVERLVYALEYGSVWLAYQPPDAGETTSGIVTLDNIHQEVSIFIDRDDLGALDDEAPEDLAFVPDEDDDEDGEG